MSIKRPRRRHGANAPPINIDLCPSGKHCYRRRASAKEHARRLRAGGDRIALDTYRCHRCGDWHVGHRP